MKWILISLFVVSSTFEARATEDKKTDRKIATAVPAIIDTIKTVREDDEGVVVLFSKNAGSYYLRRNTVEFEGLKKKLQDSFDSKKPVGVRLDPSKLNILEVK